MTHHLDVAVRRDLAARWCALAEKRLQHLTELFESGRWRRYHSERGFLENVQEAKRAVERWRALAGRPGSKNDAPRGFGEQHKPPPLPLASALSLEASPPEEHHAVDEAAAVPVIDLVALERTLKIATPPALDFSAITRRYPLLRNTL